MSSEDRGPHGSTALEGGVGRSRTLRRSVREIAAAAIGVYADTNLTRSGEELGGRLPHTSAPTFGRWNFPRDKSLHLLFTSMFSIPRQTGPGPQTPATAVSGTTHWPPSRAIHCRRLKRLRGEGAVPCGLALTTTS